MIISRSTTPDLIKIGMKLQEFFTQQFDTSKRALSTWGPGPYLPPRTPVINTEKGAAELCEQELFCARKGTSGLYVLVLLLSRMTGDQAKRVRLRQPPLTVFVTQTWMQPITATGPAC